MKKYETYKDSGIEWIGEIPRHWVVKRLKYLGESIIGVTYSPNDVTDENNGILVLRSSNVQSGKLAYLDCVYINKEIPEKLITKVGDILICARNGSADLVGKNACIDEKSTGYTFGAFMTILRAKNYRYLSYFLNSSIFKSQLGSFSTSTINQLTSSVLNNFEVAIPLDEDEQNSIADFLDHKTFQIDTLIQKKQLMIALLEEEKTALINEVVTKGLNPDAPMKYSGIEWLGNVPAHWQVKKLKYLANINEESLPETTDEEYELNYIDIGNVFFGGHNEPTLLKYKDAPSRARRIVKTGDILVSTVRTYLKAITQVNLTIDNLIASTGFAVITSGKNILDRYLFNVVSSQKFINTISAISTGVSYPAINASDLGNIYVWYPTLKDEQEKIISYINNEVSHKVLTQEKLQKEVNLLKEYRTTLISEAVTGKIDVRDYQPELISSPALA